MKNLRNFGLLGVCVMAMAAAASASAQAVRHEIMDAKAAARDIRRLQSDRAMARRNRDWMKVKQDDRLIAADRKWIRKDVRKARHGG